MPKSRPSQRDLPWTLTASSHKNLEEAEAAAEVAAKAEEEVEEAGAEEEPLLENGRAVSRASLELMDILAERVASEEEASEAEVVEKEEAVVREEEKAGDEVITEVDEVDHKVAMQSQLLPLLKKHRENAKEGYTNPPSKKPFSEPSIAKKEGYLKMQVAGK